MELALDDEQAAALKTVLNEALSELTSEIAATDNFEYRDGLRRRRQLIEAIRRRLDTP